MIGGANAAILQAFEEVGRSCRVFIGHHLDVDNLALLRAEKLSAVLLHDLGHDMRMACLQIMCTLGVCPAHTLPTLSGMQVVTPFNLPG